MILAKWWIVQHEFTISEFGAFDRGQTDDAKSSPALIDDSIMTLNRVRSILFFSSHECFLISKLPFSFPQK